MLFFLLSLTHADFGLKSKFKQLFEDIPSTEFVKMH